MKLENYEDKNERLLWANADYENNLERGHRMSIRATERFWKIPAGSLVNFRANKNRRQHGEVVHYRDFLAVRSEISEDLEDISDLL